MALTLAEYDENPDYEMITFLLENGALFSASEFNQVLSNHNLTKIFTNHASNLKQGDIFTLVYHYKKTVACQIFVENLISSEKFDINLCKCGIPLFHTVIRTKNYDLIQLFLSCPKLNKNLVDENGLSALHLAVCMGDVELAKLLIQKGYEVNARASSQITALHIAAHRDDKPMIHMLIEHNVDLNAQDKWGLLPLNRALYTNRYSNELVLQLKSNNFQLFLDPYQIGKLHKILRIPFAAQYYVEIDAHYKWKIKEEQMRTLCSHYFELEGKSELVKLNESTSSDTLNLEGTLSDRWVLHEMRKQFKKFEMHNLVPSVNLNMLMKACSFSENSASRTSEEYLKRIQNKKPTSILGGSEEHAVQFIFWDDILAISNRHNLIEIYRFDPSQLTAAMIDRIRNATSLPWSDKIHKTLLSHLKKELNALQDSLTLKLEKLCPLEKQKVGNCIFASIEGFLWIVTALQNFKSNGNLKGVNEQFTLLQLYLKLHVAAEYFDSHVNTKNPYFPDMQLCYKMIQSLNLDNNSPLYDFYTSKVVEKYKELCINFSIRSVPTKVDSVSTPLSLNEKIPLTYVRLRSEYYD